MTAMTSAMTSQEVAKEQLEQITEGKINVRPKPVEPSKADAIEYNATLQKMIKMVKKDINEILMPQLKKLAPEYQTVDGVPYEHHKLVMDSYVDDITKTLSALVTKWSSPQVKEAASGVSSLFVKNAALVNRRRFNKSMKSFGLDIFGDSPSVDDLISGSAWENAKLIESIPTKYLENVQSTVMTNVRAGNRPSAMAKQLQEQFGVTERRAQMIARDQTAKLNGDLTKQRQQSSGFEYFQWIDSNDERVRKRHNQIENKVTAYGKGIYRWDFPPLSSKGTPIIPGQDYNCRCIAAPVTEAQVQENKKKGNVKKGVKR